jgi:hypothetical protein
MKIGYGLAGAALLCCAFAFGGNATFAADQTTTVDKAAMTQRERDLSREEAILAERKQLDEEEAQRAAAAKAQAEEEEDAKKRRAIPNPFLKKAERAGCKK